MTRTIDLKRRLVLPDHFHSGDVVEIETEGEDVVIVRRMKAAERSRSRPRLVRRKDGSTVFVGGPPVNAEIVKRLLEDFP
jgi:hypothetical protein